MLPKELRQQQQRVNPDDFVNREHVVLPGSDEAYPVVDNRRARRQMLKNAKRSIKQSIKANKLK